MKDRYYRSQERKRLREQKQERERNHRERERELEQQLENERKDLISVPSSTSTANTDVLSDNRLSDNNTQEREEASGYNSEDEYIEHPNAKVSEEEWRKVI